MQVADLIEEHGPYVWRVLRHLGVADSDLDDETQEVFLIAHRRAADLEGVTNVPGWLYGVCARRAMQWKRSRVRRKRATHAIETEQTDDRAPRPSDDPTATLDARANQDVLLGILDTLDEDQRAVFLLHDVEEQPMSEIVQVLGCPLQTGYSRLRAAREAVAKAASRARLRGELR